MKKIISRLREMPYSFYTCIILIITIVINLLSTLELLETQTILNRLCEEFVSNGK